MSGGDLATGGFYNSGTVNYSAGTMTVGSGPWKNFTNEGTINLSGAGTRTIVGWDWDNEGADIVNNRTFKTTHTTAVYTGTFTNNGAYISDPATQYFDDLIVGESGYLVAQFKDKFFIRGDFINDSKMKDNWNTMHAYLGFLGEEGTSHDMSITGLDFGAKMSGYANNFSWETLDITGQYLTLEGGNEEAGAALYLRALWGAEITEDLIIANLCGFDGLDIYYMSNLMENDYLGGLTYALMNGGYLRPIPTPEPATMLLLASGLVGLAGLRKKFTGS